MVRVETVDLREWKSFSFWEQEEAADENHECETAKDKPNLSP